MLELPLATRHCLKTVAAPSRRPSAQHALRHMSSSSMMKAEIRESLESILREEGYASPPTALRSRRSNSSATLDYDVVLLDIWLPDRRRPRRAADAFASMVASQPEVVIISGHGTIESAVRATKLGAYDFLEKPLSLDRTLLLLKNATEARQLRRDNQELQQQLRAKAYVTGESVPLKALRQQIKLMAPTNGRVLIYGESGTGKERIARTMHAESLRADRVFVELELCCHSGRLHRKRTLRLPPSGPFGRTRREARHL